MSMTQDPDASAQRATLFRRGESALGHAVYGLILTIAELGELLKHDISARTSVAWLLGSGAVLLAAHMFSDVLARVTISRDTPDWNAILRVGKEDIAVIGGAVGAALFMTVAAIADLDADIALIVCLFAGLVALALLAAYATAHHRRSVQVAMSVASVSVGAFIVLLENAI